MKNSAFPAMANLVSCWQRERVVTLAKPVLLGLGLALLLQLTTLAFLPSTSPAVWAMWLCGSATWLLCTLLLLRIRFHSPELPVVAKRADAVLKLSDDLLCLSELSTEDDWKKSNWTKTEEELAKIDLKRAWPIRLPRVTIWAAVTAVFLTLGLGGLGAIKLLEEHDRFVETKAAQEERLAASEEVLKDWEEFVKLTDDPELKKLFAEAAELKRALENPDPMQAMLEINRLQEQMKSMEAEIADQSIAGQSAKMAEALEAFEGMGAMSAALRAQDFQTAADEAEKLAAEMKREPDGKKELRRQEAVSEMLATESQNATSRGNQNLSDALQQLSKTAKNCKGGASNSDLASPTKKLCEQFAQEAARKQRGRAAATGKQQLEALRCRLQGDKDCAVASLCKSTRPGGKRAGSGTTGESQGEETQLAEAGVQEAAALMHGEGESEKLTTSSSTGSGTSVAGGKATSITDYVELSQKAVEDETLPLAHRRVIRTYFERIRPIAETQKP